jgi:hypothetical protein
LDHLTTVAQALPRATPLRHAAYRWLQEQRIVRPGRTTLRDVMNTARETALQSVYTTLSGGLAEGQEEQIEAFTSFRSLSFMTGAAVIGGEGPSISAWLIGCLKANAGERFGRGRFLIELP